MAQPEIMLKIKDQQFGPFSPDQAKIWAKEGRIPADALIGVNGQAWQTVAESGLGPYMKTARLSAAAVVAPPASSQDDSMSPGSNLKRVLHNGDPAPPNLVLFGAPPKTIGRILSVGSTRMPGELPPKTAAALIYCSVLALFGLPLCGVAFQALKGFAGAALGIVCLTAFVGLCVLIFKKTAVTHCSYVGEKGIAEYSSKGRQDVFVFDDKTVLRTQLTDHYINFVVYGRTEYLFMWKGAAKKGFSILGSHRAKDGVPPRSNRWHFAKRAEAQWTAWARPSLEAEFGKTGKVTFPFDKVISSGEIVLSREGVEIKRQGKDAKLRYEEIAEFSLKRGVFTIRHRDATWYGKGSYVFEYVDLGNATLFFEFLIRLIPADAAGR